MLSIYKPLAPVMSVRVPGAVVEDVGLIGNDITFPLPPIPTVAAYNNVSVGLTPPT
jgi:hypothetical protein